MPDSPPKVLIAGAGLAGLFLAILLERAKIPYQIFERAATVKPVVGADGAYSGVRQSLYKELKKKVMLPVNDGKQLSVNYSTIVGTTNSLGEDFPFHVNIQQEAKIYEDESLRNSEWSSGTNQGLIKEIRTFKTPYGDLGKLISATDEDRISRVYVEDKLFETWHHNRTVLIGDGK
ncbi:hypothetical protein BGZ68_000413 [Mortierella alpina]|nr:hypothetical protein BGZ68_000413 [Mortierella alpina]